MNKKICYVVTIPLTIRAFFIPQIKYLSQNGFDVTVVCSKDDEIEKELSGFARYCPCDIPRGISFFKMLAATIKLYNLFKTESFDMVQYSTPNASFCASIASRLARIPVRNYHLMGLRYLSSGGIGRILLKGFEKITCKNSTHIECVSRSNMQLGINEKLFVPNKVTVVWNGSTGGVDLERFSYSNRQKWRNELRNHFGYKETDFVFGFVGRITKDKGVNELLEAFFSLECDAKLFIIGNDESYGTIDPNLWEKAKSSGNVIISEPSHNIEKYYAMIDVLVLPSYREGFGNVIIEAAAVGTPSIATDIPGPRDCIVGGKTGLFFSFGSKNGLLGCMNEIISIDYLEMGKNARKFVEDNFDGNLLCEKICERKTLLLSS